jgi:hypothetical protein
LSYIIDLGTHTINNSASWRIPVGLQMLWGLILLSGIFFLPESPRHLLGRGREEEARVVIAELNSVPVEDPVVAEQMEELLTGIRAENEGGKATWAECFSTRNMLWKRTLNGMMLQFIQQLNGQNFYCECFRGLPTGSAEPETDSAEQITTATRSSSLRVPSLAHTSSRRSSAVCPLSAPSQL